MINQEWIEVVEELLLSDKEFTIKSIKSKLKEKYNRNFGSIVVNNMLSILFLKHNLNKKVMFRLLTVRSSR